MTEPKTGEPSAEQRAAEGAAVTPVPAVAGVFAVALIGVLGLFAVAPSRSVDAGDVPSAIAQPTVTSEAPSPKLSDFGKKVKESVPQPEASCSRRTYNGEILLARMELLRDAGHALEIRNGTSQDAIVKIRRPGSDRTLLSLFVGRGEQSVLNGVPDGSYRFIFAFGDRLNAECTNFIADGKAFAFPEVETMATQTSATEIITSRLSYTLHAVPSGNVHPEPIPPALFHVD